MRIIDSARAHTIFLVALAAGVMLSSESLVILGNNMGLAGVCFLAVVLLAAIVHLSTTLCYGELFSLFPGPGGEARYIKEALGFTPALVLPLCSRVVFTVCGATAILATAGYVFNEVFVYWFPNLGFSFCLLGFLLAINLLGQRVSAAAQITFVAVAVSGLIFLSAVGLFGLEKASELVKTPIQPFFSMTRVVLLGLVLFIGFDLAASVRSDRGMQATTLIGSMVAGIVLVGIVFCLWGLVSIGYVPLERLAEITVPYATTARAVMSQKGRIIVGIALLAGTCSAVNALLFAVSRMIAGMATHGLLPPFLGLARDRAAVPLLILTLATAGMMARGMAGEPELEVYMRGGLLFWLLNYAAVHLSVLILRKRISHRRDLFQVPAYPVVTIFGLSATLIGFAGLLWSDSEPALLLKFILSAAVIVSVLGFLWINLSRRRGWLAPTGLPLR